MQLECSSSFACSVRVHQHEWTWPLRRRRLRREIRSVSNTLFKFHPCYDPRTPSLVQKYQLCACERQDTKGADLRTEHEATVANCWGVRALPVCACVLLVFCSLASVLPVFVIRVCSCGCLLRCLAVLPLLLCPLALSPPFLYVCQHPSQEPEKSLGSLRVYFSWPVEIVRKRAQERSVDLQ